MGHIEGKANTRGLSVWLSQSITFGNLAAAFGASLLRLQKSSLGSDSGRCKDVCFRTMAFGCREASPLEARLLLMKGTVTVQKHHHTGNQNQTEILRSPSPARPQAAADCSPLHNDCNIQLSRSFREKNVLLRTRKQTFARVPNITLTVFAIKTLYKDL